MQLKLNEAKLFFNTTRITKTEKTFDLRGDVSSDMMTNLKTVHNSFEQALNLQHFFSSNEIQPKD